MGKSKCKCGTRRLSLIWTTVNMHRQSKSLNITCSRASNKAAVAHRCARAPSQWKSTMNPQKHLQLYTIFKHQRKRRNHSDHSHLNVRPKRKLRRRSEICRKWMIMVILLRRVRPRWRQHRSLKLICLRIWAIILTVWASINWYKNENNLTGHGLIMPWVVLGR